MRIKDLFTVPTNQKVTEKQLYRVLISSVCSILLCMASLAGTTWAWFTVSIENTGNVIQIADLKVVERITQDDAEIPKAENGGYELLANNTYSISAAVTGGADESELAGDTIVPAYVIMTVVKDSGTETYYCSESLTIEAQIVNENTNVSFEASWTKPVSENAFVLEGKELWIGEEPEEDSSVPEPQGIADDTATPEEPSDTEPVATTTASPEENKALNIETEPETPTTEAPTEAPSEPETAVTEVSAEDPSELETPTMEDNTEPTETTQPAIETE